MFGPVMRLGDINRYIDARIEILVAGQQGRPSRMSAEDVLDLGDLAFGGLAESAGISREVEARINPTRCADAMQDACDREVDRAIAMHFTEATHADGQAGWSDTQDVFGLTRAIEIRSYSEARVSAVVAEAARAIAVEAAPESRSTPNEKEPMYYAGVWEPEARYSRSAVVTHAGTIWFCNADDTQDRPGTSSAFQMMAKSHGKGGTPA